MYPTYGGTLDVNFLSTYFPRHSDLIRILNNLDSRNRKRIPVIYSGYTILPSLAKL
jgi:hypothetical protein